MSVSVVNQVNVFLLMTLGGIGAGVFYDVFLLSRNATKDDKLVSGILDFVFWVTLALALFGFIYMVNNAQMRVYEFIGLVLGFSIYEIVFSKITTNIILWIVELVLKILVIIFKIILTPAIFLYRMIAYILTPLVVFVQFLIRILKRLLKYLGRKLNIGVKRLGFVFRKV